jgi:TPR repeat protein
MTMMGQRKEDEGDYETALKYLAKAAELGDAEAHYSLSVMYGKGRGVEKSKEKAVHHWEEAAIAGHPHARHNLGCEEWNNGRFERARKHFIIAANLGLHDSLKCLKELYANGHASKEEYLGALRGYQLRCTGNSNNHKADHRERQTAAVAMKKKSHVKECYYVMISS